MLYSGQLSDEQENRIEVRQMTSPEAESVGGNLWPCWMMGKSSQILEEENPWLLPYW